jgi:NAD(P)H-dependent FMN reductase
MKKIIAVSGSIKQSSSNTAILRAIEKMALKNCEFVLYECIGELPFFNPDHDNNGVDASVATFRVLLKAADCVIICTPEYAFGIPGVLKNALDWLVSSGELYQKNVITISASPGPLGGDKAHDSLLLTLSALGADLSENRKLIIGSLRSKMDQQGRITDSTLVTELEEIYNKAVGKATIEKA